MHAKDNPELQIKLYMKGELMISFGLAKFEKRKKKKKKGSLIGV